MRKKTWVSGFSQKDVKIQGGYEEMLMFADKVGGWGRSRPEPGW